MLKTEEVEEEGAFFGLCSETQVLVWNQCELAKQKQNYSSSEVAKCITITKLVVCE